MDTNEKMTVKIVKVRSLTTLPCTYSNTVDDGYFRYVTVDGKRVGDVVKFIPDWGGGLRFQRRMARRKTWRANQGAHIG